MTVQNASVSDGGNVFMWSYTNGNLDNDEWIFVDAIDCWSLRSVTMAVQQDNAYINMYNLPSEINATIADVGKPFYSKWTIEFRPSYYTLPSVKADDCPNGYLYLCRTGLCTNANCTPDYWPIYVGISNDPSRRLKEHNYKNKKAGKGDRFDHLQTLNSSAMTKNQARAVEQLIIERNPKTIRPTWQNKINSISKLNILYWAAMPYAESFLETNIFYDAYRTAGKIN